MKISRSKNIGFQQHLVLIFCAASWTLAASICEGAPCLDAIEDLNQVIKSGHAEAFLSHCEPQASRQGEGCQHLAQMALDAYEKQKLSGPSSLTFVGGSSHKMADRVMKPIEILVDNKLVETLYLSCREYPEKLWKIIACHSSKKLAEFYLFGHVPGDFRIRDLPSNDHLRQAAQALIAAPEQVQGPSGLEAINKIRLLKMPEIKQVYWSEHLQHGAVVLTDRDQPPQELAIYLTKAGSNWVITASSSALAIDSFFENLKPPLKRDQIIGQ